MPTIDIPNNTIDLISFAISTAQGRLTTETAVPVSTSDRTAQGTLYYTPFIGDKISLYDGTKWIWYTFAERSLSLTLTSAKNYDVFLYNNAGTLTLELSAAWTNDTTRADALTTQNGIYVKSGATTRRLLGTIRASGTNTTEDSLAKRFVVNVDNLVRRPVYVHDATDSWTYTTATWRQKNASTANQFETVAPLAGLITVDLIENAVATNATTANVRSGIGRDVTNAFATQSTTGTARAGVTAVTTHATNQISICRESVPLGYHYYAELEYSDAAGTTTWYGDAGGSVLKTGMSGWVDN